MHLTEQWSISHQASRTQGPRPNKYTCALVLFINYFCLVIVWVSLHCALVHFRQMLFGLKFKIWWKHFDNDYPLDIFPPLLPSPQKFRKTSLFTNVNLIHSSNFQHFICYENRTLQNLKFGGTFNFLIDSYDISPVFPYLCSVYKNTRAVFFPSMK